MATVVTASAIPVANVTAASPRVFIDITYENNEQVRADIMFENLDPVSAGGFHVEIGDGWNLKTKQLGGETLVAGTIEGTNLMEQYL